MDNSKWFDVKLLVSTDSPDKTKMMKTDSDSYGKHVKRILKRLRLQCEKTLHLGRNLGAKLLEMLEADVDEIRRLGNWNPSIFDNSYSTKLPLGPMRMLAGFFDDKKFYFLPRGTVMPSEELKRMTPIGKWVCDAYDAVLEASDEGDNPTCQHFLRFLCDINEVLLQDAAVMMIEHEYRADHPLFQLDCFQSQEFKVLCV